jgi:hypothetical protein
MVNLSEKRVKRKRIEIEKKSPDSPVHDGGGALTLIAVILSL